MGLSALNPFSRLRGAVRSLVAEAVADVIAADGDRTRADLASLRAAHHFVGDAVAEPAAHLAEPKPPLAAHDTLNPSWVMTGATLARDPRPGPYEPRHAYAPTRR